MATKLLITDAFSPVGQAIHAAFEHTPYSVVVPPRGSLDWSNPKALQALLSDQGIAIVINTAGWSDAPTVGQQLELVSAAKCVAQACKVVGCVVIHLSSYRVFGGENKSAYDERDKPLPLGASGRAFLESERLFESALKYHLCLRLSWVLDIEGESVFHRLLQDLTSVGPELEVTHQRRGSPVSATDVGHIILAMVQQIRCGAENWGIFHFSSGDACSSAEFTEAVAEILEREGALRRTWRVEILTEEALAAQGEPDSAALTVRRCRDNFGYQLRSWRQGLTILTRAWLEHQKGLEPKKGLAQVTGGGS